MKQKGKPKQKGKTASYYQKKFIEDCQRLPNILGRREMLRPNMLGNGTFVTKGTVWHRIYADRGMIGRKLVKI
jgi:ribosomal protein S19